MQSNQYSDLPAVRSPSDLRANALFLYARRGKVLSSIQVVDGARSWAKHDWREMLKPIPPSPRRTYRWIPLTDTGGGHSS